MSQKESGKQERSKIHTYKATCTKLGQLEHVDELQFELNS